MFQALLLLLYYKGPPVFHRGAGHEREGEEGLVVWRQRLFRISM